MLISDVVRALLRLWYIAVPVLILGAGAAGMAAVALPPTFESSAKVLFVPSAQLPGTNERVNPYLNFNQTLFIAADVVRLSVSGEETVRDLRARGLAGDYGVEVDKASSGPVLLVTGMSDSRRGATETVNLVVEAVQESLVARQLDASAPQDSLISTTLLSEPTTPVEVQKKRIQVALVVFSASLAIGVLLVALVERSRRSRRRDAGPPARPEPGDFEQVPPERPGPPAARVRSDLPVG